METLYEILLKLKQETSSIAANPVLDRIDIELIKDFEKKETYKSKLDVIRANLKGESYIFSDKHKAVFDAYNELVILEYLNTKIETILIPEKKDEKTPDYKLCLSKDEYVYSDLKTLHYFQGNINYTEIQNESADAKIETDKKVKEGKQKIIFSSPVSYSPFKKGNDRNYYNVKNIIEDVIDKIKNLLRINQVNYDDKHGIFLIDTVHLYLPMELELGLPIHNSSQYNELISGILWNTVFGEIGDPTYNWVEFEGKPNIGKRLEKNGIFKEKNMSDFENLKSIAFIVNTYDKRKIISFHRSNETDDTLLKALYKICDFVNDELNTNFWKLKKKK